MSIKKVVVAGGGVLGSQIAFQTAYCGFDVTVWLRSPSSITRTQPKLDAVRGYYIQAIEKMKEQPDNPAVLREELRTERISTPKNAVKGRKRL